MQARLFFLSNRMQPTFYNALNYATLPLTLSKCQL